MEGGGGGGEQDSLPRWTSSSIGKRLALQILEKTAWGGELQFEGKQKTKKNKQRNICPQDLRCSELT